MRTNKKSLSTTLKKFLLVTIIILIFTLVTFEFVGHFKISYATKKYFRDYVKITDQKFIIYKQNASISVLIENLGKRLLDSIVVKINYYDAKGKFLSSDMSDVLKTTKDVLYPGAGKIFRIDVTCPEKATDIKLSIK